MQDPTQSEMDAKVQAKLKPELEYLLRATMAQFQKPEDEVRAILDAVGTFTIDKTRDVIWFSAG